MLSERLLIMRLITSVGLALLLVLGVALAGHLESDESAPAPLSASVLLDPHLAPLSDEPPTAVAGPVAGVGGSPGANTLVGAALCMLGLLCGLAFAVLARRLLRHDARLHRGLRPRMSSPSLVPVMSRPVTVLSLTQLSLSRT